MSAVEQAVKIAVLEEKVDTQDEELAKVRKELDELKTMATRWKGFGAALIALGSALGVLMAQFDHIKEFLGLAAKAGLGTH